MNQKIAFLTVVAGIFNADYNQLGEETKNELDEAYRDFLTIKEDPSKKTAMGVTKERYEFVYHLVHEVAKDKEQTGAEIMHKISTALECPAEIMVAGMMMERKFCIVGEH